MAKPFSNLLKKLPPERRERIEAQAQALLLAMAFGPKQHLTQPQLAELINRHETSVSQAGHSGSGPTNTL